MKPGVPVFIGELQNQTTSDSIPTLSSVLLTLKYLLEYCFTPFGVIL